MTESAIKYLKRLVFPYLTHEEKMFTGKFFYEAEIMEKKQIIDAYDNGCAEWTSMEYSDGQHYYNNTYGK